jgi:hypothetical protein
MWQGFELLVRADVASAPRAWLGAAIPPAGFAHAAAAAAAAARSAAAVGNDGRAVKSRDSMNIINAPIMQPCQLGLNLLSHRSPTLNALCNQEYAPRRSARIELTEWNEHVSVYIRASVEDASVTGELDCVTQIHRLYRSLEFRC